MKQLSNEEVSRILTDKIYSKICDVYQSKMIHVPPSLSIDIKDIIVRVLNEELRPNYFIKVETMRKNLDKNWGRETKARVVMNILLNSPTDKVWTLKELSDLAKVCSSTNFKLKHRLLFLNALELAPSSKVKFRVTDAGKKIIANLLDIP